MGKFQLLQASADRSLGGKCRAVWPLLPEKPPPRSHHQRAAVNPDFPRGLLRHFSRAGRRRQHISKQQISLSVVQNNWWSQFQGRKIINIPMTKVTVFFFLIYLFIYFWLCWVFVSVRGLSLVVASGGHSSSRCAGLSLSRPLLLRGTGSRRAGSVVVAHGLSCPAACGIFPDQGSSPCPLHWQADSQPLRHQGSPKMTVLTETFTI